MEGRIMGTSRSARRVLATVISLLFISMPVLPAAAAACEGEFAPEGGGLKGPIEVKLSGGWSHEFHYSKNGNGPAETGKLKVKFPKGKYEEIGTCLNKSLKDGEKCEIKLRCLQDLEPGEIEVKGTEAPIIWWSNGLECIP
jgi:hypothetical protein